MFLGVLWRLGGLAVFWWRLLTSQHLIQPLDR
jgi:hypothetical protein